MIKADSSDLPVQERPLAHSASLADSPVFSAQSSAPSLYADKSLKGDDVKGAVARGTARLFARHDIMLLPDVSLRDKRHVDLMGLDAKGQIIIVEIRTSRSDLLSDHEWTEYLDFCDRFYWAVPSGFDQLSFGQSEFHPDRAGLIVADGYDAEIIRPAATHAMSPAKRKTETSSLARKAIEKWALASNWLFENR